MPSVPASRPTSPTALSKHPIFAPKLSNTNVQPFPWHTQEPPEPPRFSGNSPRDSVADCSSLFRPGSATTARSEQKPHVRQDRSRPRGLEPEAPGEPGQGCRLRDMSFLVAIFFAAARRCKAELPRCPAFSRQVNTMSSSAAGDDACGPVNPQVELLSG